jgi:uncharacterized membrane protein
MPRFSVLAPAGCSLAGLGCAWWWIKQGSLGPWLVVGLLLAAVLVLFALGCSLLRSLPIGAGYLVEAGGAIPSAIVLVATLALTHLLLDHAVGPSASARVTATYGVVTGAAGVGLAALFTAFDPVSSVLPSRLKKAFPTIEGTNAEADDARWALSVLEYTPQASGNVAVSGWGWAARRERLRQIARAL